MSLKLVEVIQVLLASCLASAAGLRGVALTICGKLPPLKDLWL